MTDSRYHFEWSPKGHLIQRIVQLEQPSQSVSQVLVWEETKDSQWTFRRENGMPVSLIRRGSRALELSSGSDNQPLLLRRTGLEGGENFGQERPFG
ncbi:MAG: hypothetical protein AAF514_07045, partial [Verrucomicrobiota bacterium]